MRTLHGNPAIIGQHLHKQIVASHSSIHPHFRQNDAVRCHGSEEIADLKCYGCQCGMHDLGEGAVTSEAQDCTSSMWIPVRRAQTSESRHHIEMMIWSCG